MSFSLFHKSWFIIIQYLTLKNNENNIFSALTLFVWDRKSIQTVKIWVMWYWHGYLSGVRCKWSAYGPADVTATHHLLPEW